jgi:hypothetical protein
VGADLAVTGKGRGGRPRSFDKLQQHQRLREIVSANWEAMIMAQVKNAQGIKYLVSRDKKTGKFTKLTEEEAKLRLTSESEEVIEVWDERPNVQAFTDLANRHIDKPTESIEAKVTVNDTRAQRVFEARKRADGKR